MDNFKIAQRNSPWFEICYIWLESDEPTKPWSGHNFVLDCLKDEGFEKGSLKCLDESSWRYFIQNKCQKSKVDIIYLNNLYLFGTSSLISGAYLLVNLTKSVRAIVRFPFSILESDSCDMPRNWATSFCVAPARRR